MDIKRILREIVVEGIPIQDYLSGEQETIIIQKTRQLDILFKRKALERVVSQYYYNHFNKLIMEQNIEEILPLFKEIKEDINNKNETETNLMFVNCNPANNHSILEFMKVIEKAVSKKWIKSYCYVLEQRGETIEESGKGFHTHIIIQKDPTKSFTQGLKELARNFNKVCDSSNFHLFQGSKIKLKDIDYRRNYILGWKADESKHQKQRIDKIWRRENFLKDYYGNKDIGLDSALKGQ